MRVRNLLLVITIWVLGVAEPALAQQLPQYTQFQFNWLAINPAYTGMSDGIELNGHLRRQWVGLEGSPFNQHVNANMPVPYWYSGVGIAVTNDLLGAERNTRASFSFAYKILRKPAYVLSLGMSLGVAQKSLDGSLLISPDGVYGSGVDHQDGVIPSGTSSGLQPDVGLGAFAKGEGWTAGVSMLNVTKSGYKLDGNESEVQIAGEQHLYGTGSYRYVLTHRMALKAAVLLQSNLKQLQGQASLVLAYDDFVDVGVALRGFNDKSLESLSLVLGAKLSEQLRLGYSYDAGISGLNGVNSGSHEIVLNYRLKSVYTIKGGKVIYNPRFL